MSAYSTIQISLCTKMCILLIKCDAYAKMYRMKNTKKDSSNCYRSYVAILRFFINWWIFPWINHPIPSGIARRLSNNSKKVFNEASPSYQEDRDRSGFSPKLKINPRRLEVWKNVGLAIILLNSLIFHYGTFILHMTSEGLAEMFEGYFADTCGERFLLMSMGGGSSVWRTGSMEMGSILIFCITIQ